jgi:hypothetical protein
MAKRYQKVLVTTWIGETIRDASDAARVLFFYLLSGPETTLLTGLVPVNVGTIANRLRWPDVKVREAFAELDADGAVAFDDGAGVAWLPNAIEHNPPMNPNVVRSWERAWDEVPKCPLKVTAYQSLRRWCEGKGASWLVAFDAACRAPRLSGRNQTGPQKPASGNYYGNPSANGIGNPSPNQKQYQEQKQQQNQETQNAGAGAPAYACTHEGSPDTSPAGHVVAEVVSTEPPPSRTPPAPVEVVTSSRTAPSCPVVAPLAASAAEDDDEPPPAQRVPSTPRPGASVQAASPVAPATPSAPVVAAPPVEAPVVPVAAPSAPTAPTRGKAKPSAADADIVAVFEHWRDIVWKGRAVLNDQRRARIAARLAEGFTVDDLKRAVDGASKDDWLMGRDEKARQGGWRDVETVFRHAGQVERLMLLAPAPRVAAPPAPAPTPKRPPPLPPHLAGRPAPVMDLATFLARGLTAPEPRRLTEEAAHVG